MQQNRIKIVEEALGVRLPEDYADFLVSKGMHESGGIEVYGYNESIKDVNRIPCVIGATRLYREDYQLSPDDIVISHSGVEDEIIVLVTSSGRIFTVSHQGREEIAASFHEWFNGLESRK